MVNNLLPVPRIERNRIELICCCCSCSFVFSLIWTINISHVKFIQPADSTLCMTSDTGVIPILFILLYLFSLSSLVSPDHCVFSKSLLCVCMRVQKHRKTYARPIWTVSLFFASYNWHIQGHPWSLCLLLSLSY